MYDPIKSSALMRELRAQVARSSEQPTPLDLVADRICDDAQGDADWHARVRVAADLLVDHVYDTFVDGGFVIDVALLGKLRWMIAAGMVTQHERDRRWFVEMMCAMAEEEEGNDDQIS